MAEEVKTEGFDAIVGALKQLYPDQEGLYYGTVISYRLGGNDPLDGVEIYSADTPQPHWHYVTYGLTELYEKETESPEISGYGFELTFRLKKEGEETPPVWPVSLLQNLARYVFQTGNVFGAGHHMNLNGPIALEEDTKICAIGFIHDPQLPEMDTPNGHFEILQVVGLTLDEMEAQMCWRGENFFALLQKEISLGITDLRRDSLLERPAFHRAWEEGVARDGSSTGFFYTDEVNWSQEAECWRIRMGAGHAKLLCTMLAARVGKGRDLRFFGNEQGLHFQKADAPRFDAQEDTLCIGLSDENLQEISQILQPKAGVYRCSGLPLQIELVLTRIKDTDGNVIETIG